MTPGRLAPGHPVLAAQHWTGALLTLDDTGPGGNGASPQNVLSDLGIVASWVLRQAPAAQFAGLGPAALAAWREWNQQASAARRKPGRFPPASAALTAALAATAMTMLTGSDEQAIAQIRALLPPRAGPRQTRPAGLPAPRWRQLSAAARGRFLRALDPDLGPADRIRYRTGTPQARIPDDPPGLLAARARAIPQLLWPEWAIRLMPARGFASGPFRSTIAACLLLPGHPGRATGTAITALHGYRSALATGSVLRALAGGGHDTVLTADQLPGRLPRQPRQPHRLPAPPRPHPRRNDHRRAVARAVLRRCRAPRRGTPAPRCPALPVPAAHRRRPARPPARPRVHLRQRLQPLPDLRRNPPHRPAGRAARPRRRAPARPRHRRAADLGTATRLLRPPDPARTRTGRHRPGRRRPPHHHRHAPRHRARPRGWAPPPATSGSRSNTSPGPPASGAGPPRPRHGSGSSTPAPS